EVGADDVREVPEGLLASLPQALGDIYAHHLDALLDRLESPRRAIDGLSQLAWIGRGLSQRVLRWAMEGSGVAPEVLLRQGWLSRHASAWEASYGFTSEAMRQVLTERSRASGASAEHLTQGLELLLRDSLEAMIRSDWEGALSSLRRAWRLNHRHAAPRRGDLRQRILIGTALVHYRQRDADGVQGVAVQLEAVAAEPDEDRDALLPSIQLWRGAAAVLLAEQDRAEALLSDAVALAARNRDPLVEGFGLQFRGQLRLMRGDIDRARKDLKRATRSLQRAWKRTTSRYVRDLVRLTEADVLRDKAEAHSREQRPEQALELLERALRLHQAMGDLHGQAYASLHQARILRRAVEAGQTLTTEIRDRIDRQLREAAALMDQLNDNRGRALLTWERASTFELEQRFDEAQATFRAAALTFTAARDPFGEALCVNSQGEAARRLGRSAEALSCYRRFLDAMTAMHNAQGQALAHVNTGWVHLADADLDQAHAAFSAATAIEGAPDPEIPLIGLAAVAARRDQPTEATRHLHDARAAQNGPITDPDALAVLQELAEAVDEAVAVAAEALMGSA
ncbi:MAG: hypothetical protein CMH57_01175, partial [Myxococcales bacterium]|nr:hypothetical protein [Myxococcales bacterium]